uniref:Uncharacterized protein n=1 Tax=Arundo donax TaxID=35708 RepID=A0A0A9BHK7_ARUDO
MMASSSEAGRWSDTSVRRGLPRPTMKSWICWSSVNVAARQARVRNLLQ